MRRVVIVIVVALVGAGFAGHFVNSSAATANGAGLSNATLSAELTVIEQHQSYACFLTYSANLDATSSGARFSAAGAARWATLQLVGLRIEQYAAAHDGFRPTAATLQTAESEYANDLSQTESTIEQEGYPACATTATVALDQLPAWFLHAQLVAYAATQSYESHLPGVTPLTTASLRAVFSKHPTNFDTICAVIAVVPESKASAFDADLAAGATATELATKYSADTSLHDGDAGCVSPTASEYTEVRELTAGLALNTFGQPYEEGAYDGTPSEFFVGATKRTVNTFKAVEAGVLLTVQQANESVTETHEAALMGASRVGLDQRLGTWSNAKVAIVPPAHPPKAATPDKGKGLTP